MMHPTQASQHTFAQCVGNVREKNVIKCAQFLELI